MNPLASNIKNQFLKPFTDMFSGKAKPTVPSLSSSPNMSSVAPRSSTPTSSANMSMAPRPMSPTTSTPATPNMSMAPTSSSSNALSPGQFGGPTVPSIANASVQSGDPNVRAQQIALNAKGAGLKEDGLLGPITMAAIKRYGATTDVSKTSNGGIINPATGGVSNSSGTPPVVPPTNPTAPVAPKPPTATEGVSAAEEAYKKAVPMTPDEEATQKELATLTESFKSGYQNIDEKVIPLTFITGQQSSLEKRALNLAEPLNAKLARLQAKRTSALDASKFALERADKKLETEQKAKNTEAFTLGEGQRRFDATGKEIAINPATPKAGEVPTIKTINGVDMQWDPVGQKWNPASAGAVEDSKQKQTALSQLSFLKETTNKALELAGASGRSGARKTAEAWLVGSTDYTNLEALTNTLRTNVLTLMTDPSIKKFFGPQMSEADVRLMTAAGTTLNPESQSPEIMKTEINRLVDLFGRMEKSLNGTGGENVVQTTVGAINTNW